MRIATAACVAGCVISIGIAAQRQQDSEGARYEVTSVKVNKTGDVLTEDISFSGTLLTATSVPLRNLILFAYDARDDQLVGGPAWLASDRFDVAARAATDPGAGRPPHFAMLRSLLADRFGLHVHYENREVQGFELRLARAGVRQKLKVSACVERPQDLGCAEGATIGGGVMAWRLRGKTMAEFAKFLQVGLRRPVTDGTGLSEKYDFDFTFRMSELPGWASDVGSAQSITADDIASDTGSVASELKESLGLSLNRQRVTATFLVIDSVRLPDPN